MTTRYAHANQNFSDATWALNADGSGGDDVLSAGDTYVINTGVRVAITALVDLTAYTRGGSNSGLLILNAGVYLVQLPVGMKLDWCKGLVITNNGTIANVGWDTGQVTYNYGTIADLGSMATCAINYATITTVSAGGIVGVNRDSGTITTNNGTVDYNYTGTVTNNRGLLRYNQAGAITNNYGLVIERLAGVFWHNESTGIVLKGSVTTNNGLVFSDGQPLLLASLTLSGTAIADKATLCEREGVVAAANVRSTVPRWTGATGAGYVGTAITRRKQGALR